MADEGKEVNDLAIPPLAGIELFSGVGMLGEGLRAGFAYLGIPYRAVCHVEREAYAAGVLAARMEEGSMDEAPVWSDVVTFDAAAWRGKVDCIVAGFPCQDLSVAGRRAGLDGKRSGLFFEVTRIASDCGAWLMLLENVAGIASATASVMDAQEGELDERAASRVMGELADLGWNAEWITLSASDVGASHGRARWFCVAWRSVADARRVQPEPGYVENRPGFAEESGNKSHHRATYTSFDVDDAARHVGDGSGDGEAGSGRGVCEAGDELGNTESDGRREGRTELPGRPWRSDTGRASMPVADTSSPRRQGRELKRTRHGNGGGQEAHGSTSQLCSLFAPGPAEPRWGAILERNPELAPALEPGFRGVVNGMAFAMDEFRAARLRCIGNGVVPLQAATAVVELLRRAGIHR